MKTIYCISGLGADEKAFSKLKIDEGYRLKFIPWMIPIQTESIEQYAARMLKQIEDPAPILLGLSFGGIMCTEIAKLITVKKIIIVSSIKTSNELPSWMRTAAWLGLNKLIPLRSTRLTAPIQNRMLGVSNKEDLQIAQYYRKHADKSYIKWAVHQVINWQNKWIPPCLFHIHGDNDKMFPIKKVNPDFIVKNGGHFMIMNRAGEVSSCINSTLQDNQ